MALNPGDIVLVPFPYRDHLGERARLAAVVSSPEYNRSGDLVVAAITSHTPRGSVHLTEGQAKHENVRSFIV